jgi:hypothetical protein
MCLFWCSQVANNHGERQRLFGFRCLGAGASAAETGVVQGARLVTTEGTRAGAITSFLSYPSPTGETAIRGLAYVRKNMGDPGSKVGADKIVGCGSLLCLKNEDA